MTWGTACASRSLLPLSFENFPVSGSVADSADFAGSFRVLSRSCGSPCHVHDVVDLRSGDTVTTFQTSLGVSYRLESRLLVADPPDMLRAWCFPGSALLTVTRFYVATGSSVVLADSLDVCK